MGQVTNALPTTLSAVKAALGTSSPNNLRAYLIGGAAGVPAETAGHLGFIPSSGTVNLSRFRDATRVGTFASSYSVSASAMGYAGVGSTQSVTMNWSNAGVMSWTKSGSSHTGYHEADSSTYTNLWALRGGSSCLANTCGNWQIKLMKTAGNATAPSDNNAWVALSTTRSMTVSAAASGDMTDNKSLTCNVQIRRADTLAVVGQFNVTLSASASSTTGPIE